MCRGYSRVVWPVAVRDRRGFLTVPTVHCRRAELHQRRLSPDNEDHVPVRADDDRLYTSTLGVLCTTRPNDSSPLKGYPVNSSVGLIRPTGNEFFPGYTHQHPAQANRRAAIHAPTKSSPVLVVRGGRAAEQVGVRGLVSVSPSSRVAPNRIGRRRSP